MAKNGKNIKSKHGYTVDELEEMKTTRKKQKNRAKNRRKYEQQREEKHIGS